MKYRVIVKANEQTETVTLPSRESMDRYVRYLRDLEHKTGIELEIITTEEETS